MDTCSGKVYRLITAGVEVQLRADTTNRLIRYNVSWIATQLKERLQQCQARLIKVWKVCSAYLWDGSVSWWCEGCTSLVLPPSTDLWPLHPPTFHSTCAEPAFLNQKPRWWTHYACHRWGQAWLLSVCMLCYCYYQKMQKYQFCIFFNSLNKISAWDVKFYYYCN